MVSRQCVLSFSEKNIYISIAVAISMICTTCVVHLCVVYVKQVAKFDVMDDGKKTSLYLHYIGLHMKQMFL